MADYRVKQFNIILSYISFSCQMAYQIVLDAPELKPKWTASVEWLNDELERVKYNYFNNISTNHQYSDY